MDVRQSSALGELSTMLTAVPTPPTGKDYIFTIRSLSSLATRAVDNETSYVGADGQQTSICEHGTTFTLLNNSLSSHGLWVSASPKLSCRFYSCLNFALSMLY